MKVFFMKTFLFALLGVLALGCGTSKKVNATSTEFQLPAEPPATVDQDGGEKGNCPGPTWGKDSVTAVKEYSLYDEFFQQKNYQEALPHWRYLLINAPKARLGIYVDGETLMEYQITNAKDAKRKDELIDTLMKMYDQRIACFNKEGYVLGKKGVDLVKYKSSEYERANGILNKSIELEGNNVLITVPYSYIFTVVRLYQEKKMDLDKLLNEYERISKIIQYNINQNGQYIENWRKVQEAVDNMVSPFVPCEELVKFYKNQYKAGTTTPQEITKMTEMLSSRNCTQDPFYLTLAKADYSNNPSWQAALQIAKGEEAASNTNEALNYYKKALEGAATANDKADINYSIASIYKNRKECSTARSYALAAVSHRQDGKTYILLGDIIVACAGNCDDKISRSPYWVAVDYYQKAKNVDGSVAEIANSRIATYSAHFPTIKDVFFYNLKDGDSYTVGCWINETTTVRTRKGE